MNLTIYRILSFGITISCITSSIAQPAYRGVSYTAFTESGFSSPQSSQSVTNMQQVGVDTVALNVIWFQDNANSTSIAPDFSCYSASTISVIDAIRDIQGRGMNVMLKPMVDLRDGRARQNINPSAAWFDSYAEFMNGWADVAADEGVALLSVGNELSATQGWSDQWREVIGGVRSRYDGAITYGANWDAYQDVDWWDATDYVGMSAYFPISESTSPSPADLELAWDGIRQDLDDWRQSSSIEGTILFTEAGYRSGDGATQRPYDFETSLGEDLHEQAEAYRALLNVMWDESWFDGAFWWNWEVDPLAGGSGSGFTPQNKPAQEVLAEFYLVPEPAAACVLALGLIFGSTGRRQRSAAKRYA